MATKNYTTPELIEKMKKVWPGFKKRLSKLGLGISGMYFAIRDIPPRTGIGCTLANQKIICLSYDNVLLDQFETIEKRLFFIMGVFTHEVMHQLNTDFDANIRVIRRIKNPIEAQIYHNLQNVIEDPSIEYNAPRFLGGEALSALRFAVNNTYRVCTPIDQSKSPFEQYTKALIQYGDGGFLKGSFSSEEAKEMFVKTLPIIDQTITEPNGTKRVALQKKVFEMTRPLWEKDAKEQEEMMKQLNELFNQLGKNIAQSCGSPQNSSGDANGQPDSTSAILQNRRKITFRKISKEEAANLPQNAGSGGGLPPDGDIEILIVEDDDNNSQPNGGAGIPIPMPMDSSQKKQSRGKSSGGGSQSNGQKSDETGDGKSSGSNGEKSDKDGEEGGGSSQSKDGEKSDDKKAGSGSTEAGNDPNSQEEDGENGKDGKDSSEEANSNGSDGKGGENDGDGKSKSEQSGGDESSETPNSTTYTAPDASTTRSGSSKISSTKGETGTRLTYDDPDGEIVDGDGSDEDTDLDYEMTQDEIDAIAQEIADCLTEWDLERNSDAADAAMDLDLPEVNKSYSGVKVKNVKFKPSDAEHLIEPYMAVAAIMRGRVNRLVSQLRRIIRNDAEDVTYRCSGRVNIKRLSDARLTSRVFDRRIDPGNKADMAVCIVVDNSGSMSGNKIRLARECVIGLVETFAQLDIPVKVMGFTTGDGADALHYHYVNWRIKSPRDRAALMNIEAHSCNFDGFAIRYASRYLQKRPEENKLLIVISDGQPSSSFYCGRSGIADTKDAISEASKFASVIGVGIDADIDILHTMYGPGFLEVKNVYDLFDRLADKIKKEMKK